MAFTAVLFGLMSAVTWGAGDFSGGMAVKRTNPYGVVISAHVMSLFMMVALALIFGEKIPPPTDWLWGAAAGLCGGVGLALLYRALATGQMSVAAPVSALVAASLPVLVSALVDGLPRWITLIGFVLALAAVESFIFASDGRFNLRRFLCFSSLWKQHIDLLDTGCHTCRLDHRSAGIFHYCA
jgi:uncharacterized membrane protein